MASATACLFADSRRPGCVCLGRLSRSRSYSRPPRAPNAPKALPTNSALRSLRTDPIAHARAAKRRIRPGACPATSKRPADETGVDVRARRDDARHAGLSGGRSVECRGPSRCSPVTTPDEAADMAPTSPPPPSRPVRLLQTESAGGLRRDDCRLSPSPTGRPAAWLPRRFRWPATLSPAPEILNRCGGGSRALLGIVGDSVWTDSAQPIPPPPVDTGVRGTYVYKAADTRPVSARLARSQTPRGGSGSSFHARSSWRLPRTSCEGSS